MNLSNILLWLGLFFVINWAIKRFALKTQDILFLAAIMFLLNWGVSMFVGKPAVDDQVQEEQLPNNKEIDFEDVKPQPEKLTEIMTPYARFVFSSHGASLRVAEFHKKRGAEVQKLQTLMPLTDYQKEESPFLVAFDEKTPFYYDLVDRDDEPLQTVLVYKARSSIGTVKKKFIIHNDAHKVDLQITVDPQGGASIQPRLFLVSPFLEESEKTKLVAGVVQELHKSVNQYYKSRSAKTLNGEAWIQPTLFGAEDRYFITALVHDAYNFAQRGYFKVSPDVIHPILEGPRIEKEMTWDLSFFVGPKEGAAIAAVDSRLEPLLNYGMFGFLSKLMLKFLKWLNTYTNNFGWSIIIMTFLLRLFMLPITLRGTKTQERMKELGKKEEYIKRKYKNDPQALERERIKLVQAQLGSMAGCLPMLLQFPLFLALSSLLRSSIELYNVSWLWIPNLAGPDPFYVMPLLIVVSMFSMAFTQKGDVKAKMVPLVMGIGFGAVSINFSAGLNLYIALSSILGSLQAYLQKTFKK